jgi:ferredoxin
MGVVFRRCLRVYDADRRFNPVFEDGERMTVGCDTVLIAAGQSPDLSFLGDGGTDVKELRPGWPKVDPSTLATTAPGVFVAGDLAHGTRLLIDAVASGKRAARAVYRHVTGRTVRAESLEAYLPLARYQRERGYEAVRRTAPPTRSAEERLADPSRLIERVYTEAAARREASRCLDCGVTPVFDGERCVLCGGCVDVCPTCCLKLVPLDAIVAGSALESAVARTLGDGAVPDEHSAILKDEDRCIRCALCALRCPADAITMERVRFTTTWSSV